MKLSPFATFYFAVVLVGAAGYLGWKMMGSGAPPATAALDGSEFRALDDAPTDPAENAAATAKADIGGEIFNRPLIVAVTARAADVPTIVANRGLEAGNAASIYHKQYGIDVVLKVMHDRAAKLAAFQTGQIDMMWETADEWAVDASRLAGKSIAAEAVMLQAWSRGEDGIAGGVARIEDLPGKRVAVPERTSSHWLLLYLLARSSLTSDQRQAALRGIVVTGSAAQAAALLERGDVDAAVTREPYLSAAARREGVRVLASTATAPHVIADILVARRETIDQGSVAIKGLIAGWLDAAEEVKRDPQSATALVGETLGLDARDTAALLSGVRLATYADNAQFFGLTASRAYGETLFETAQRVWRKRGSIATAVTASDWYDPRMVAALAGRYKARR